MFQIRRLFGKMINPAFLDEALQGVKPMRDYAKQFLMQFIYLCKSNEIQTSYPKKKFPIL